MEENPGEMQFQCDFHLTKRRKVFVFIKVNPWDINVLVIEETLIYRIVKSNLNPLNSFSPRIKRLNTWTNKHSQDSVCINNLLSDLNAQGSTDP